MLQSRRFGAELLVGLHSDEEIAANKGPTVMNLAERVAAVNACRFSTKCIPDAPYVTSLPWMSHYGCQYVTHGDDITSDASGYDCYRYPKKAGRMKIVPRTPGISTTDLVGRMLGCTKDHFIANLMDTLEGRAGSGTEAERISVGKEMRRRIKEYAAAPNGLDPLVEVRSFEVKSPSAEQNGVESNGDSHRDIGTGNFTSMVTGTVPRPGQRVVYVDGGFDLFSSGHIAFLRTVSEIEETLGHERGWTDDSTKTQRIESTGSDYGPAYVIAGVHDDAVINQHRGVNYPIMNIYERGLCVVQCAYIHGVVFGAPYTPSRSYLESLPFGKTPDAVYHGPTAFMPSGGPDPYTDAKAMRIFQETPTHDFQEVNAAQIVQRILDRRDVYEERQRKKGAKVAGEEEQRRHEHMEREEKEKREQTLSEGREA